MKRRPRETAKGTAREVEGHQKSSVSSHGNKADQGAPQGEMLATSSE